MSESDQTWQPMETLPENGWVELMTYSGDSSLFLLKNKKPYRIYDSDCCEYYYRRINEGDMYAWRLAGPMNLHVVRDLVMQQLELRREAVLSRNEERKKRLDLETKNKELRAKIKELRSKEGVK